MSLVDGPCRTVLEDELAFAAILSTSSMVETLFYGIHFMLFCICIVLFLQPRRPAQWPILVSAIVLFALATAEIALRFREVILMSRFGNSNARELTMGLAQASDIIFVASNFVAELTLLYRCYVACNRSKYIFVVCSVLVTADTVWGLLSMGPTHMGADPFNKFIPIYIWSVFAINIVLTLIIVVRIFWISSITKRLLGERKRKGAYRTAIAILVESSAVYSLCLLIFLLWPEADFKRRYMILICFRVVGIMPTLLIVQIRLGGMVSEANKIPTTLPKFQVNHNDSVILTTLGASMMHGEYSLEPEDLRILSTQNAHDKEAGAMIQEIEMSVGPPGLSNSVLAEARRET